MTPLPLPRSCWSAPSPLSWPCPNYSKGSPMLRAEDLTFAYPGQATPYVFSFEAEPGRITAISGASGSGKSTLLDLLGGFLAPASGTLTLDNRDLLPLPPE